MLQTQFTFIAHLLREPMKSKLITAAAVVCAIAVVFTQRIVMPTLQFLYELIVDAFNEPVPVVDAALPVSIEIQQKPVATPKRTVRKRTTATTRKQTTKTKPNEPKSNATTG